MVGPDQLTCDNCGGKTDHRMSKSLSLCPPILTISLLRFNFDYSRGQRYKGKGCLAFLSRSTTLLQFPMRCRFPWSLTWPYTMVPPQTEMPERMHFKNGLQRSRSLSLSWDEKTLCAGYRGKFSEANESGPKERVEWKRGQRHERPEQGCEQEARGSGMSRRSLNCNCNPTGVEPT